MTALGKATLGSQEGGNLGAVLVRNAHAGGISIVPGPVRPRIGGCSTLVIAG